MAIGIKLKAVFTRHYRNEPGPTDSFGVTNFNHFKYCDYTFASKKAKRKNVDSKPMTNLSKLPKMLTKLERITFELQVIKTSSRKM